MEINRMEEVLNEMEVLTPTANLDIANVPYPNRSGMAVAIADAKTRLIQIELEYKEMLNERAFTLLLFGKPDLQALFVRLAQRETEDAIAVDAGELYRRLALAVEPALGAQRQFGGTALGHLIREVENAAREADTGRLTQVPRLRDVAIVRTVEDVAATCKEIVLQDTGSTLNLDYIQHLAFKRAFDKGCAGKTIPVIILNSSPSDELVHLFNGRYIEVEVDVAPVDRKFVLNTFQRIREELGKTEKQ